MADRQDSENLGEANQKGYLSTLELHERNEISADSNNPINVCQQKVKRKLSNAIAFFSEAQKTSKIEATESIPSNSTTSINTLNIPDNGDSNFNASPHHESYNLLSNEETPKILQENLLKFTQEVSFRFIHCIFHSAYPYQ